MMGATAREVGADAIEDAGLGPPERLTGDAEAAGAGALRFEVEEYISQDRLAPPSPLMSKEEPVFDLWFRLRPSSS